MTFSCKYKAKLAERNTNTRLAAIAAASLMMLTLAGCGSKVADMPPGTDTDDPAAKAATLRSSTAVPPQAKEQMLRQLEKQQGQQPAGTALR